MRLKLAGKGFLFAAMMAFALQGCALGTDTGVSDSANAASMATPAAAAAITASDIGEPQTWGGLESVVAVKHVFFAAQPDAAALKEARNHGVGAVINLREPSESEWDEAGEVKKLGLTYYNVPIPSGGTGLSEASMEEISRLVRLHSDQKILLHCSSGNRAAAWLATHLVNDHHMDMEPSLALAQKAGLTSPKWQSRVNNYLGIEDALPE